MTLSEFRRRIRGRVILVRVAHAPAAVRTTTTEAVRLFRLVKDRIEVSSHASMAFITVRPERTW